MRVLSAEAAAGRVTEARLETSTGDLLPIAVGAGAEIRPEAEISLGIVGLAFALLAAAVLVRRPHDLTARLFALFGGLAAVALGVAPAAGGPHPAWALIVQFVSILAVGATVPAFAGAFVGNRNGTGTAMRLFWLFGGGILTTYLFALVFKPAIYEVVRTLFGLYLTVSIFAALGLLARRASGPSQRPAVHEARLALAGIACGSLPFVILTLIPVTTGYRDVVPWYITASLTGFIPAAFAYAAAQWKIEPTAALQAYLWAWLENQVMAAVKAVPLGQTDGQRILLSLGGRIEEFATKAMQMKDEDLGNFAPGLALLSARHETQYSRLFRS